MSMNRQWKELLLLDLPVEDNHGLRGIINGMQDSNFVQNVRLRLSNDEPLNERMNKLSSYMDSAGKTSLTDVVLGFGDLSAYGVEEAPFSLIYYKYREIRKRFERRRWYDCWPLGANSLLKPLGQKPERSSLRALAGFYAPSTNRLVKKRQAVKRID